MAALRFHLVQGTLVEYPQLERGSLVVAACARTAAHDRTEHDMLEKAVYTMGEKAKATTDDPTISFYELATAGG